MEKFKTSFFFSFFFLENCQIIFIYTVVLMQVCFVSSLILRRFCFYTGMRCCFCIFQNTVCCCCDFRGSSVIKSHVLGYWSCPWTTWCLLVKSLDSIQTAMVPQDSNTRRQHCFYAFVSHSCHFCARSNPFGPVAADIPISRWFIEEVSIVCITLLS